MRPRTSTAGTAGRARRRALAGGLLLLATLAPIAPATGRVFEIRGDGGALTAALDQARAGDTLRVAAGHYVGTFEIRTPVALIAPAGSDSTILDGGDDGPVLTFDDVDAGALVDGFTITGGLLRGKRQDGAGILCRNHASPRINNNHIHGNRALGEDARGGGIACLDGSNPVISNNRIEDNHAAWGGGLYVGKRRGWHSSPVVSANQVIRNHGVRGGGGFAITHTSQPVVSANVIAWNVSHGEGGAAFHIARAQPIIQENTIWANIDSAGVASAIRLTSYAMPVIERNIIARGVGAPAIACVAQAIERVVVTCNNVWGHEAGGFAPGCAVIPGNISVDPVFCDPDREHFGLRPSSPCLAHAECGRLGPLGIGCQEPVRESDDDPVSPGAPAPRSGHP